jgi:hypothetical protein
MSILFPFRLKAEATRQKSFCLRLKAEATSAFYFGKPAVGIPGTILNAFW